MDCLGKMFNTVSAIEGSLAGSLNKRQPVKLNLIPAQTYRKKRPIKTAIAVVTRYN
jgi:hypothetical protein